MRVLRPTVHHVHIVYRWVAPFPIRYEVRPGEVAIMELERDEFDVARLRWKLAGWTQPGNVVRAWSTYTDAEWDCRYGLTFTYSGGIPDIMRPMVRARLAEVVIGPHTTLSYGVDDEEVWRRGWWPVPPKPHASGFQGGWKSP